MPEYIIQFLLATAIGTIAYFLRDYKAMQHKKDEELQKQIDLIKTDLVAVIPQVSSPIMEQIESIKKDLSSYKLEAAEKFASKDEFIRASSRTDRKLDSIHNDLMKLIQNK